MRVQASATPTSLTITPDDPTNFTLAILGDLHMDPRKMEDYETGRGHVVPILDDAKNRGVKTALVSLGDLGESKSVRPEETAELTHILLAAAYPICPI